MIFPPRSSYVEPGSYPHILNREYQTQKQLHRLSQQHAHGEKLECQVLQQAGARQEFLFELVFRKQAKRTQSDLLEIYRHQPVEEQRAHQIETAHHKEAENKLPGIVCKKCKMKLLRQ